MPEDYAAFRARRQAELAADPNSKPELTGTRTSKPESTPVAHGPMRAVAPPPAKVDKATGKAVVNLDRAAEEEDAVASAHKSMSRGVQPLDMDAIKRADAELAGYDKKPKAEKEAIDSGRLAQAQKGLKEARVAPDIDSIVSRRAPAPEEAAPAPKRATRTRRQTGRVEVSQKAPEAPAAQPSTEAKAAATETPSAPMQGSSQFSGMLSAHAQHGNLVSSDGPKPKLGKDVTYFGGTGGPKPPEQGKRGGPAYNTQQAYKKHVAGGGTPESYWQERDAKAAAKKPKAPAASDTPDYLQTEHGEPIQMGLVHDNTPKPEAKASPAAGKPSVRRAGEAHEATIAEPPKSSPQEDMPASVATDRAQHSARLDAAESEHLAKKSGSKPAAKASPALKGPVLVPRPGETESPEPKAVSKAPSVPESGTGGSGTTVPKGAARRSSPVPPKTTPNFTSLPESGSDGSMFPDTGLRRMGPERGPAPAESAPSRNPRQGVLFNTNGSPNPRAVGSPRSQGRPGNVPSPVAIGQQFGGEGVHHHHYYGNVNQGTGTQINGNVGGHVMTDNASIGGTGGGGGSGRGGNNGSKNIITGNPTGVQRALYSAIHTSVNGRSIASGVNHVTGGGHLGMEDSEGRPIGRPSDPYVQNHEANAGSGGRESRQGTGQYGDVQQGQFSRARASRQQATPTS